MADPTLTASDIADAVKIIDYAADGGAFHGWDNIRQILVVRDKLYAFATAVVEAQEAAKKANTETEAPSNS